MKRNLKINFICIGIIIVFSFPVIYFSANTIFSDGILKFLKTTLEDIIDIIGGVFIYPGIILGYILSENFCFFGKIFIGHDIPICIRNIAYSTRANYLFFLVGIILFYASILIVVITMCFKKFFKSKRLKNIT